ncbi:5'-nucleotidase SurE [Gemmatimonas aurantiaca T-27]|uniref:5'-nucleotidase SurE n=1 Tax=Gemmatimonas aurantiaca (strain DSM 14586 / JCM 11422 / NBRC 100505 / T-27) TaxID=379066 RepID=SURE_GEMAT|nr:RecName: Full=5'-nucleotidase SurE; AltName: Full=Nucleoside 5'-monophosphate phosphohydrolase [Gemmatimonas aurantiaca T-27]BAH38647.1 5'-nucleotidase SurE [Gemmatimonas aurantiaca T-27]
MRILLSNDDGILAKGLGVLERAAESLGELHVVAPDREQSATSHSLTLHHPLRPVRLGERRWQVDGTPTDCVMLACEALLEARPDFVLSGINHGPNMGEDVLYSGTVAAAMEGLALGIPAIALSFAGNVLRADALLDTQVGAIRSLLHHLTGLPAFPADTLLNVNLPAVPGDEIRGIRLTRLGRRVFSDSIARMKDPWGRDILWIGGGSVEWSGAPDSDFRAVHDGYISVTPLHLDLTHRDVLNTSTEWWQEP